MTDMNKLINGIVQSMDEEDLEYLIVQAETRLAELSHPAKEMPEYTILCSCGSIYCPACRGFNLKVAEAHCPCVYCEYVKENS